MNRNLPKVGMPPQKNSANLIVFLIFILLAYVITTCGLLVLAFLLYRFPLSDSAVNIGIIIIYALSTFLSSFICGKKLKNRKFIWGLCIGAVYFLILLLLSVIMNESDISLGSNVVTTLMICAGSGMLGGMLA